MTPLVTFIVELLGELIREAVTAAQSSTPAEAERQALIRAQRRISDEIAKRELK